MSCSKNYIINKKWDFNHRERNKHDSFFIRCVKFSILKHQYEKLNVPDKNGIILIFASGYLNKIISYNDVLIGLREAKILRQYW